MKLEETAKLCSVLWETETESTNTRLRELANQSYLSDYTLVVTANQTAGRGRLTRSWVTPAGQALATSLLLPKWESTKIAASWAPLLVGAALQHSLTALLPVSLKWPNDILAAGGSTNGKKLCGILCETLPDGRIIAGAGINLFISEADLPTPQATSLTASGVAAAVAVSEQGQTVADPPGTALADAILAGYVAELKRLFTLAWTDPERLRQTVTERTQTIGQSVRAELPDGTAVIGTATGIGDAGELTIKGGDGLLTSVAAGDVWHLRPVTETAIE